MLVGGGEGCRGGDGFWVLVVGVVEGGGGGGVGYYWWWW